MDKTKKTILIIAQILTAIGAINWGLTTVGTNLVSDFLPKGIQRITFFLIGIAGIITLFSAIKWATMKDHTCKDGTCGICENCDVKKLNSEKKEYYFPYGDGENRG